jgi:hypothetical protein
MNESPLFLVASTSFLNALVLSFNFMISYLYLVSLFPRMRQLSSCLDQFVTVVDDVFMLQGWSWWVMEGGRRLMELMIVEDYML